MKKALSLFLVLTFAFVMFASVSVNAYNLTETVSIKDNYGNIVATLTADDTYYYNYGYECVKVTDTVTYETTYKGLKNFPVVSSVVFVYTDYEIPTVKQANSYVATTDNQTVSTYVYSEGQYTVISVYVYHKLNQGTNKVANYSGKMEYIEFLV